MIISYQGLVDITTGNTNTSNLISSSNLILIQILPTWIMRRNHFQSFHISEQTKIPMEFFSGWNSFCFHFLCVFNVPYAHRRNQVNEGSTRANNEPESMTSATKGTSAAKLLL